MCLQNCKQSAIHDLNEIHAEKEFKFENINKDFLGNCDYIDIEQCKEIYSHHFDLIVMELNIRGLIGKQYDLLSSLSKCTINGKVNILILVETWLTSHSMSQINVPGYTYSDKCQKYA